MTAELVKGRIKSVARKPAAAVAISGVRYAKFDVFSCSAKVNQAKARPYSAADGMARSTEIPAKKRKCRRYMRNVSSSRSPISSGRSRSGTDTLTYLNFRGLVHAPV